MKTSLNAIRSHGPCLNGWEKLLCHLGKTAADNAPLLIETILDSNGFDDASWTLRAVEGHDREIRLYAVWCARQVQHLMSDPRSVEALDVAERFARGRATAEELRAARTAALGAAEAWAASAAARAASAAARAAAWEAATAAAWEAAGVAAWAEASAVTSISESDAARAAHAAELRRICREIEAGRDPYREEAGR